MRKLVAVLTLCVAGISGYAQEGTEAPAEVTIADDTNTESSEEASVEVRLVSNHGSNCNCGKKK